MTTTADVVVVGGGVIGASVAYMLARKGSDVVLLDASLPGRATSASAGGLWPLGESLGLGCGVILAATMSSDRGPDVLPRAFMDFLGTSNDRFPELAADLRATTGIDIEAESGTGLLYLLYDDSHERHAAEILEHTRTAHRAAELWTAEQVREREPLVTSDLRGAVWFPDDNQVNPMLLAEGLKRAAVARGGRFVPEARVRALRRVGSRIEAVVSDAGTFTCGAVVNAAGAWAAELADLADAPIPVFPVRGQILCTERLRTGTLRSNLSTPDCYILQKAHGEVIVGSTTEETEFDVSVRDEDLRRLASGAIRAVPALRDSMLKRTWAGLRPGTPDELPILGPDGRVENLYHAAGGFRTGIVAAPLTGAVVAACVMGNQPSFPVAPFLRDRFAT
jgi:hydrogen cyanide synthase HcnC